MSTKLKVITVVVGYVAAVGAVLFLWRESLLLTLALLTISAFMLFVLRSKRIVGVYLFAMFWGPLTEAIAIAKGVWRYELPEILGFPLWLPFLWGAASIVIVYSYEFLSGYKGKK